MHQEQTLPRAIPTFLPAKFVARLFFSFRNRSSSSMSCVEVCSAPAGAKTFRASRFSEMAANSWVAARADFSWVSSGPECSSVVGKSDYFWWSCFSAACVHLLPGHSGSLCNSPRKSPPRMRTLLAIITFSCCSVECGV